MRFVYQKKTFDSTGKLCDILHWPGLLGGFWLQKVDMNEWLNC